MEDNNLIAEFMGWKHYPKVRTSLNNVYGGFDGWTEMEDVWILNPTEEFEQHLITCHPEQVGLDIDFKLFEDYQYKLYYDTEWDRIMPVVQKINSLAQGWEFESKERDKFEEIFDIDFTMSNFLNGEIDEICKRCSDFINWYNKSSIKRDELWEQLGDTPINDEEEIEVEFLQFEKGTHREEIWHWFESEFNFSIGEAYF